jgi:hypothetical protein
VLFQKSDSSIFWYSFQIILNKLCDLEYYSKEYQIDFSYESEVLMCKILHIQEPGKLRNLVKGTGILNWFLTPGSKLLQSVLACMPDHIAGLELGGDDWSHVKRMGSQSHESYFMYDSYTGKTLPSIVFSYKDWTESTDFISKRIGIAHLSAFMHYIGFPVAYGKMIMLIIREPQPVVELVNIRLSIPDGEGDDAFVIHREPFEGYIREGYMMGNPVTKTILHLIHVSEKACANLYMEK